ncbi:TPA_asm: RNA-directed RNA polymerase, partial [ssRNA phage ESE005]
MHTACWTDESTPDESLAIIRELAFAHALRGGHQGELIAYFIVCDDYLSICEFELDYDTLTTTEAANCRQALAFYQKCDYIVLPGVDPREVAKSKFKEAELACQSTNEIFRLRRAGLFNFEPWVDSALRRAQHKITRVLGRLPHVRDLKLRFGPGATTLTKKKNASVVEKLQAGVSCSESLLPYASRLLAEMPQLTRIHNVLPPDPYESLVLERIELQKGLERARRLIEAGLPDEVYDTYLLRGETLETAEERISQLDREIEMRALVEVVERCPVEINNGVVEFVPKNAKTHRSIVKEPSLNTMVQLALGDYMAKRLHAFGIDIRNQEINKSLAKEGSLTGELGTLDLSSASDTISNEIVHELLPLEWAFMLSSCRTDKVYLDAECVDLEKFSSMGNGYTFPLETLIFWALASSAAEDGFASVYGDDIIVGTHSVNRVMRLLEVCGFSINRKKSYWTGSFRESCGGDFLRGIDIRPYYHKKVVTGMELFKMHNFYVRHHNPEMAERVLAHIHPSLRIYGPDGYGDGHLIGDWTPRRSKRQRDHGYGGVLFDTFKLGDRKDFRPERRGDAALPTYSIYTREGGDAVLSLRDTAERPLTNEQFALVARRYRTFVGKCPAGLSQAKTLGDQIPERVSPVTGVTYKLPSLPGVRRVLFRSTPG